MWMRIDGRTKRKFKKRIRQCRYKLENNKECGKLFITIIKRGRRCPQHKRIFKK